MLKEGFPPGLGPVPVLSREHGVMVRLVKTLRTLLTTEDAANFLQVIAFLPSVYGCCLRTDWNPLIEANASIEVACVRKKILGRKAYVQSAFSQATFFLLIDVPADADAAPKPPSHRNFA